MSVEIDLAHFCSILKPLYQEASLKRYVEHPKFGSFSVESYFIAVKIRLSL